MPKNIKGIFTLEIDGKERELKCNLGAVEDLEERVLKRPIIVALNDAMQGAVKVREIVDVIMVGLKANGDTRFKRDEVGEEVIRKGMAHYLELYIKYLTYAVTGEEEPETETVTEEDKKK